MRKLFVTTIILLAANYNLQAQESDYEALIELRSSIEMLSDQIRNAITSEQLERIESDLIDLELESSELKELYNRVYHPNNLEIRLEDLKRQLITNEQKLIVIEHQREQLFDLSSQLLAYRSEIQRLYSQTDSLRREIQSSQASEARLSELITQYREQLEKRDQLVFEMIDSLMITHQNKNVKDMEISLNSEYLMNDTYNPLLWIEHVVDANVTVLNQHNNLFQVEDYIRVYALQGHFQSVWDKVGDDIITVYGGDLKNEFSRSIEQSLDNWKEVSSNKMWNSITNHLAFSGIQLSDFEDQNSFFTSLDEFIEQGINISKEEFLTSNSFNEYLKLDTFWSSTFKNEWNHLIKESILMEENQIQMIDVALTEWENESRPVHPMLVAILSIMLVSLTGFILVMIRSKSYK